VALFVRRACARTSCSTRHASPRPTGSATRYFQCSRSTARARIKWRTFRASTTSRWR
jgi:hypothetical protein